MVIRYNRNSFKKPQYINQESMVRQTSLVKTIKQLTPENLKYLLSITQYLKSLGYYINNKD